MPRLLDLFCGVGGASMGYHLAGFDVTGVDILPQPNYPFHFVRADALEYLRRFADHYDVVHASPPCQVFSMGLAGKDRSAYEDLLTPTLDLLGRLGVPYIVENVPGAPMPTAKFLCGTMFGLPIFRHRLFECWPRLEFPRHQTHTTSVKGGQVLSIAGHGGQSVTRSLAAWRGAMVIPWAYTHRELVNAIPPAYTRYLGRQLM